MIEVTLNVEADGRVMVERFAWPTVEEDGFSPEGADDLYTTLGDLLDELDGGEGVQTQVTTVSYHLFENYYHLSSRVTILHAGVEFSRIEYNVVGKLPTNEPKTEEAPITRVSRYDRSPVI
jgi:hypothetical protein